MQGPSALILERARAGAQPIPHCAAEEAALEASGLVVQQV